MREAMSIFIIILLLAAIGWEVAWRLLGVKPMSPWRLEDILKTKRGEYMLIDVRTALEYRWFHIEGVPNHPNLLRDPDGLTVEDPTKPVVVICMSGHRSPIVGYRLKRKGFKDVSYLTWGLIGRMITAGKV
jgi:rhodanese-related sulfurtransferase